jgi:hypothetical protein
MRRLMAVRRPRPPSRAAALFPGARSALRLQSGPC